jgi:LPXTG-site transpeptidase (sortase) family protein
LLKGTVMNIGKINRLKTFIISGALLALIGLVGVTPTIYYELSNNSSVQSSAAPVVAAAPVSKQPADIVSGHPTQISIPSLNITLPVIDGYYNRQNGEWTLTLDKAQFATPSTEPNNKSGNTIIYGHYRKGVFASLHTVQPGAIVSITTSNGYVFEYRFSGTYAVSPTDTTIFSYQGPAKLTVQTCSGAWFQNRQMFQFDYIDYKKI